MKALAIDSANPRLSISAVNNELTSSIILDIGMHQSERIIPSIEQVLTDCQLTPCEIEFASLCLGPGTFTGLRLSFAALKGIQLNYKFPIYAFDSLFTYASPFLVLEQPVLSVMDAKKNRFYLSLFRNGKVSAGSTDAEIEYVKRIIDEEENIILTGPDAEYFAELYENVNPTQKFAVIDSRYINISNVLLKLGNESFLKKETGLAEFAGPVYIRPSEAEEARLNGS